MDGAVQKAESKQAGETAIEMEPTNLYLKIKLVTQRDFEA